MSIEFGLRLSLMFLVAFGGWELGMLLSSIIPPTVLPIAGSYYQFIMTTIGAVLGFVLAPYVTVIPYRALREHLHDMPARTLIMSVIGLLIGLFIAALLALPLSLLPGALGQVLPFITAIVLGSVGATTMIVRGREILNVLGWFVPRDTPSQNRDIVLLDTSVIIDGRIADICQTGFIRGTLMVPRFVLDELQHIADSPDNLRRNRGRRGLDILNRMQKDEQTPLEISEMDVPDIREVDAKLVHLARDLNCPILTNDYNLNRVAELQGIEILNMNELANAVKAVVLPGETLEVHIIQEGTETGQGVGYLDDGTMIVVENGKQHLDSTIEIMVTRVLQTVAGRMIFGQLRDGKR